MPCNQFAIEILSESPREPMAGNVNFDILWKIMEVYELTPSQKLEINEMAMIINSVEAEIKNG